MIDGKNDELSLIPDSESMQCFFALTNAAAIQREKEHRQKLEAMHATHKKDADWVALVHSKEVLIAQRNDQIVAWKKSLQQNIAEITHLPAANAELKEMNAELKEENAELKETSSIITPVEAKSASHFYVQTQSGFVSHDREGGPALHTTSAPVQLNPITVFDRPSTSDALNAVCRIAGDVVAHAALEQAMFQVEVAAHNARTEQELDRLQRQMNECQAALPPSSTTSCAVVKAHQCGLKEANAELKASLKSSLDVSLRLVKACTEGQIQLPQSTAAAPLLRAALESAAACRRKFFGR